MQKDFGFLAGSLNNRMRILICLAVLALAAGCAATPAPRQTVFPPVYSDSDCQAAVRAGAQAMADCSREHTLAKLENRPADYARAREIIAGAAATLHPARMNPAKPEYERIAVCFETVLTGIDRVMAGQRAGDQTEEAIGWEIFDQSAGELLLMLEPYAGSGAKGQGRGR